MKAKYYHYGNDCIIYDQIICDDNVVVKIRTYEGWFGKDTDHETKVCLTNAEARRMFYAFCHECEKEKYDCEYRKED